MELGIGELVVILVVVLIFFGPTKLPQVGEALGRGIRNFQKAASEPDPQPTKAGEAVSPALPETSDVRTTPATHTECAPTAKTSAANVS